MATEQIADDVLDLIGRTPMVQGGNDGRDHHNRCFSLWLAGGGLKAGYTHGQTDEFGHKATDDVVTANDYQATVMDLSGLDHSKLIFHYNGQEQKLTNGRPARIVKELMKVS